MNTPQYVYVMQHLGRSYPGGREVLKDITLAFLPGAKIGVLGLNGAGKSTLLKIMGGLDSDFTGEGRAADGCGSAICPRSRRSRRPRTSMAT